jgi:hypothetical protein
MEGFCCFVRVQLVCPSLSFCRTLSRSRKSGVVVVGVLASRTARLQQSSSQGRWKEGTYLPTYHDLAKFWLSTKNEVKIV